MKLGIPAVLAASLALALAVSIIVVPAAYAKATIVATSPLTDEVANKDFDIKDVGITSNDHPFLTVYGKAGGTTSTTPGLIYAYAFIVDDGSDDNTVLDHYLITSHGGIEDSSEVRDDTNWHAHGFEVIGSEACGAVGLTELIATEDGEALVTPNRVMLKDVETTIVYEVSTIEVTATLVDGHVCINVVGIDNVIVPDV
jgi:hypothetical protein